MTALIFNRTARVMEAGPYPLPEILAVDRKDSSSDFFYSFVATAKASGVAGRTVHAWRVYFRKVVASAAGGSVRDRELLSRAYSAFVVGVLTASGGDAG